MGKFLLGLVIGVVVGALAMTYNPDLPERIRAAVAQATALVMRGTERAAEAVGEAADEVADEAREAKPVDEPGAAVEQPAQGNQSPPAE